MDMDAERNDIDANVSQVSKQKIHGFVVFFFFFFIKFSYFRWFRWGMICINILPNFKVLFHFTFTGESCCRHFRTNRWEKQGSTICWKRQRFHRTEEEGPLLSSIVYDSELSWMITRSLIIISSFHCMHACLSPCSLCCAHELIINAWVLTIDLLLNVMKLKNSYKLLCMHSFSFFFFGKHYLMIFSLHDLMPALRSVDDL